jgi:hypothetical protein
MVKLEHIYIRLWSKHGLVFLSSLGGIVSIGTAETGCALARTFELLLIIGMVKKKEKILLHLIKVGDS